jgi:predicted DNA-binding transcriptional regulator YafY
MTRSTARVLQLLEVLQNGGTHTSSDLAERLAVDVRTVRRYVDQLRDLDVPVDSERGRYGGYRLARHYRMPPLMFTEDEALAVVWGLLHASQIGNGPASPAGVESAAAKVRRVLPPVLAGRIDAVVGAVAFADEPGGDAETTRESSRILVALAEAARDGTPVVISYGTRRGRPVERSVQPHKIVAVRGLLYLAGLDESTATRRRFRLDRITGVTRQGGSFEVPPDVDPVRQVIGPLEPSPHRHDVSVRVRADVRQVRQFFPETLAAVTPVTDGIDAGQWLLVFVRAERLEWVARRLAALDREFVIEEPEALHDAIADVGRQLIAAATAGRGVAQPAPVVP